MSKIRVPLSIYTLQGKLLSIKDEIDRLIKKYGPDANINIHASLDKERGYGGAWRTFPSVSVELYIGEK